MIRIPSQYILVVITKLSLLSVQGTQCGTKALLPDQTD